jgi:hypothetical protein
VTDQGKGGYVAFVTVGDWSSRHPDTEVIQSVFDGNGEMVLDFEQAVAQAEELVRNGRSGTGELEVVELAVTRRAIVKRAVEVSIQ